jgi:hypothetical protein
LIVPKCRTNESEIEWLLTRFATTSVAENRELRHGKELSIFEHSADDVWNLIRDFNNYPVWVDGAGESEIESGKSGDSVGSVRNVLYEGRRIRQKLLAMSDVERSQTYEFAGAASVPVQDYRATLRVTPGR